MKAEVYPSYAEQLNEIARRDPAKRGIWAEVLKRTAELMDRENGHRNAYPLEIVGSPEEDPQVREALRKIATGSERGRWVFLSIAAREILRRERKLLVLAFVLVLVAVPVLVPGSRAVVGSQEVIVIATPGEVNRFDSFLVTVKTGQPNTSFILEFAGKNGFSQTFTSSTDEAGSYVQNVSAYWDYGQYEIRASIDNATSVTHVTIGCDPACLTSILQGNGVELQQLTYAELEKWGLWIFLGVMALETPRVVAYFRRWSKIAQAHGAYTPREAAMGPFVLVRGHINPADNVVDPKNPQNPRIEIDLKRRELMEQLNRATAKRYMEWNPDHIGAIEELTRDLNTLWTQEAGILPTAAPSARTWTRPLPRVKSLGPTLENRGGSAPIVGPEYRSHLNAIRLWKWAFILVGIPAQTMALLVIAARLGVYVDALRWAWTPFPDDVGKMAIGMGTFILTGSLYVSSRLKRIRSLEEKTPVQVLTSGEQITGTPSPRKKPDPDPIDWRPEG